MGTQKKNKNATNDSPLFNPLDQCSSTHSLTRPSTIRSSHALYPLAAFLQGNLILCGYPREMQFPAVSSRDAVSSLTAYALFHDNFAPCSLGNLT